MKTRILKSLESLVAGESSDIRTSLIDELKDRFDEDQVRLRAEEAYDLIIHNYGRFEVSTIDSFFSKILKSFARELNLPLSYEVEINTQIALNEVVENLYRSLEDQPEIKEWITQYAKDQIDDDRSWNVDQQIQKLGKNLFNENFQDALGGDKVDLNSLKSLITRLKKEVKLFENTAKSFAEKAFVLLDEHQLTSEDFHYKKSGPIAAFYALEKSEYSLKEKKRFIQALDGEMPWGAKKSSNFDLAEKVGLELTDLGNEALIFTTEELPRYNTAKAILKNIYAFGLLESLHQKLKEYRDEHNVMLISDTNSILKEVLLEADAPFMFEKLGSVYKHIMIDEFQDTSNFQWYNLKPLIINALSEDHEVLIVGDVKQSIYRFRGGNMRLLLSQIKEDLGLFYPKEADMVLDNNFRSLSHIVEFNNAFFDSYPKSLIQNDALAGSELFDLAFKEHRQNVKKAQGGYVEISLFDEEDWKDNAIENLILHVRGNLAKEYQYSDMLILVNRNAEITDLANRLLQENIPFINGDSLKLQQSDLVNFLLELLRYLNSDKDEVQTLSLITIYNRLFDHKQGEALTSAKGMRMTLSEAGFPSEFWERIHVLRQKPLFDLIFELLIIFEMQKHSDLYLQQFLDVVLDQSQRGRGSIMSFLEWWEKEGDDQTVATSEDANAIRILTIHKSKGLESPIVFLPFTSWDILPNAKMHQFWTKNIPEEYPELKFIPLDFSKTKLEESFFSKDFFLEAEEGALDILNKTYVAFTRPKHKLIISAPLAKSGTSKINAFLPEILEEMGMNKAEEETRTTYSSGKDLPSPKTTKKSDSTHKIRVYPQQSYLEKLSIRNDSDRFFMLQETEQAQQITLGNQVHDVLSDIIHKEDLPMILRQRSQAGEMSKEVIAQVEDRIEKLFKNEQIRQWFSDAYEVYNERSIWFQGREHQPDRLLFKRKEAIVIDYKKEKESLAHIDQVKRYMSAIRAMGFEKISGYLIYVEPVKVKEVEL